MSGRARRSPGRPGTTAAHRLVALATVTTVGKILEPTVLSYLEHMVLHERTHIRQIESIVKKLSFFAALRI